MYTFLAILNVALSQEEAKLGRINVPLTIGGATYDLSFSPELESSENMAKKLCVEQGANFGITQETITDGCIVPIMAYLDASITSWLDEKILDVPMTIRDNTFNVRFIPERDSVAAMATTVCREQAVLIGTPPDSPACIGPMTKYLQSSVNSWITDKFLDTSVTVNGKTFDIRFMPERERPETLARSLCIEHADSIGSLTNENVVDACIRPVISYIEQEIDAWYADKTLETKLVLNDKEFDLVFMPSRDSVDKMARKLCVSRAEDIGGITVENIVAACITPVSQFLQKDVQSWAASKTLKTTLKLNDKEFTIAFMPSREKPISMARKLCIERAADIGGLNDANIALSCIQPVETYLATEVRTWLANKSAA